jgi:PAS domain S-box-containing protein
LTGDLAVKKIIFIALTIVLTGACAFLFNLFYKEAENTTITELNEEQMIHAKQAARGIEDFFATWIRSLNSLSKMDEIIDNDAVGKRYMSFFYEANQEQIRSITLVDERGVILYNYPQRSSDGADISDQKHVRELLRDHRPVISDVFRAIEGFDSVALYVPIFRGVAFKGGIAILVNFESIANRYLDVIKIGETGYAWVVSRDGTQIYSPISEFSGKSVFEAIKDSPSRMVMVNDMLNGHEGAATYTVGRTADRDAGQSKEYAVYMPVHLGNTFWSIAVASAEQDVLSGLISFRNKLAIVIGAIFILGVVFSTLVAKAWLIVKEEEKRKQAEKKLQESVKDLKIAEEKYRSIFENALEGIYQTSPGGQSLVGNPALARILGYNSPEEFLSTIKDSAFQVWVDPIQRLDYVRLLEQNGVVLNYECEYYRKDKTKIWVSLNARRVVGPDGETLYYSGFIEDISERKRVEQTLAESRAQTIATVDSTNDLIWTVDPVNYGVVTWNRALEDYFLRNRGIELRIGMTPEQLVPPEFVSTWKEFYMRSLREGSFTAEYCVVAGTIILQLSFNLLKRDEDVFGISIFGKDITERKRAEEALTRSEAKFRSYIESAPLPIFVADREGRLIDFNPAATDLFGYDAATLRNMHILDLHPEYDREEVLREFATLLETGHVETELRAKKCDGQIIWVSLHVVMALDELSIGYCQDITERRLMQERITAAAEQWQATFDSIQDPVMILDPEFRILRANAAAVSRFGLPLSRILANRCHNLMHGTDSGVAGCPVEKTLQTMRHEETELFHEEKKAWLLVSADPILDSAGNVLSVVHMAKDITGRKQVEAALRQREKDLMTLTGRLISTQEEELRRLSRELHDDLTQRLAVLAMDAGMIELQLRPLNTQSAQETRDLKTKLIEVSEDVHDLSRQLHPSILDDLGLVQAIQSECAVFTKRTGIALSFEPGDLPDAIPDDIALCLYRVIQEGLRNISRHAKTNEARIALERLDDGVTLLIQDSGIGFDLREATGQLGIGLAGMRERVRLVSGTMSVSSEPGKGTEIEISIPLGGKHGQTARTDRR